jgi:hypothetical protein
MQFCSSVSSIYLLHILPNKLKLIYEESYLKARNMSFFYIVSFLFNALAPAFNQRCDSAKKKCFVLHAQTRMYRIFSVHRLPKKKTLLIAFLKV